MRDAQFVRHVKESLVSCGLDFTKPDSQNFAIGAAVSGGADSTALLIALSEIVKTEIADAEHARPLSNEKKITLHVITVNHNIRSENETQGDADFVRSLCDSFFANGVPLDFTCVTLGRGEVSACAKIRGGGIEEAARHLRYKIFTSFAAEKNLACLCLAHNKNDALETILMRFFQGGAPTGIKKKRDMYLRPLIDVARHDIEAFLRGRGISWRTDSTNDDVKFLRNKMRCVVMPFLDENISGWRRAVLQGTQKISDDEDALFELAKSVEWKRVLISDDANNESAANIENARAPQNEKINNFSESAHDENDAALCLSRDEFGSKPLAVQTRILYRAFDEIAGGGSAFRVPYSFVRRVCNALLNSVVFKESASGVLVEIAGGLLRIRKIHAEEKTSLPRRSAPRGATDKGFCAVVEREGAYKLPFGVLTVLHNADGRLLLSCDGGETKGSVSKKVSVLAKCGVSKNVLPLSLNIDFPFCVRSRQIGDEVETASGGKKTVSDIFSNWKVVARDRNIVPLVQELRTGKIVCIWGSALGYDDWLVKRRQYY